MARLGALSAASVSTPISLSFYPAPLSEDKRQAVNFHGSHGLSVTHTHTHSWFGLGFFGPFKECFQGGVNTSGFLACDARAGRATYTQQRKTRVCLGF